MPSRQFFTRRFAGSVAAGVGAYSPATDPLVNEWIYAPTIGQGDGTAVSTWTAGKGTNATQATGGSQPLYKTGIQNGKAVVRFDGVDDFMATTAFTTTTQAYVMIVAFSTVATTNPKSYVDGIAGGNRAQFEINTNGKFGFYAGTTDIDTANATTAFHVMLMEINQAASRYRMDGAGWATFSATPGNNDITGLTIGAALGGSGATACDIGEVIIRSGTISPADEAIIMDAYMRNNWNTW